MSSDASADDGTWGPSGSENKLNHQLLHQSVQEVNTKSIDGGSIGSSVEELQLVDESASRKSLASIRQHISNGFGMVEDDGTIATVLSDTPEKLSLDNFVSTPVGLARLPSAEGALSTRAFSIVPKGVWEVLRGYYGGGPVIPAIVCNVLVRPLETPEHAADAELLRGAWVDINPLMLHVSLCHAAGIPMTTPNETVAYRIETVDSFVSRVISNFLRQTKPPDSVGIDLSLPENVVCVEYVNKVYAEFNKRRQEADGGGGGKRRLDLQDVVRLWTLVYDEILHDTLDDEPIALSENGTTTETPPTA